MAELDLISATHYDETLWGEPESPLRVRVTPIKAPAHRLGPDYTEPHFGIFAASPAADFGWVALYAVPENDVADKLAELDDPERLVRVERLSILIGVSWAAVAASARRVSAAQQGAVVELPPQIFRIDREELLAVRGAINAVDPAVVAVLLAMTYHWQTDVGGTRGPV